MSEQERAAEYRRMMQARQDNRLAAEKALAGDPSRAAAVRTAWEPMLPWEGWDPVVRVHDEEESPCLF